MVLAEAADPINHPAFPKAKPLRFKAAHDSSKKRERSRKYDTHRRKHHKRRHHYRDGTIETNSKDSSKQRTYAQTEQLDPDAAFRESLWDAMADEEGAEYWQSVYGQPIHEYSPEREGPDGKLEHMTEDQYVEYVRAEMWKKTNAGLLEEQERRRKVRQADEERDRRDKEAAEIRARMSREDKDFQSRIDASLRRGREREESGKKRQLFERYQQAWEQLANASDESVPVEIPWPTLNVGQKELQSQDIEAFMRYAAEVDAGGRAYLPNVLKAERVRWHPDKVQQRAKGRLDEVTLKKVTAVFQMIDDLWMKHKH